VETKATSIRGLDEVVRWRFEQLVASGFADAQAASIAQDSHYDLHALIELVERGCQPELAVRILAPLAGENAA
jgi:hypothetical protein